MPLRVKRRCPELARAPKGRRIFTGWARGPFFLASPPPHLPLAEDPWLEGGHAP